MLSGMALPTLMVSRGEFSIEEPWSAPAGCQWISMKRSTDGSSPRLETRVALYADTTLNVLFRSMDDAIVATHLKHDAPLYEEDVVEMFLAPTDATHYYEIEVNPLGTTFDAAIDSPDGVRKTMRVNIDWDCADLFVAVRKTPGMIETVVRIPFRSLDLRPPAAGSQWRGNFFRIDRSLSHGDEFSAWQPTMKNPPDFHVPAAFGRIVFA